MSKPFRFKQFSVAQDKCAMKIGTDGVLLGAWVTTEYNPKNIIDIGTGTGLLALMMAQRFPLSEVHAMEIDKGAYQQSASNFKFSSINC